MRDVLAVSPGRRSQNRPFLSCSKPALMAGLLSILAREIEKYQGWVGVGAGGPGHPRGTRVFNRAVTVSQAGPEPEAPGWGPSPSSSFSAQTEGVTHRGPLLRPLHMLCPLPWFAPAHPKATSSGQIQPPVQEAAPRNPHKDRGHTQPQLPVSPLSLSQAP